METNVWIETDSLMIAFANRYLYDLIFLFVNSTFDESNGVDFFNFNYAIIYSAVVQGRFYLFYIHFGLCLKGGLQKQFIITLYTSCTAVLFIDTQ